MSWVLSYFIYFPVSRLSPPVISSEPSRVSASEALIDWTLSETDNLCVSISTCGLHSAAQYKVTALFFLPLLWLMSLECWEQHRLYSLSLPLWRAGAAWPVIICWRDSVSISSLMVFLAQTLSAWIHPFLIPPASFRLICDLDSVAAVFFWICALKSCGNFNVFAVKGCLSHFIRGVWSYYKLHSE